MTELWKPIPGYGGHFEASSFGRIKRNARTVTKFCGLNGKVVRQLYQELILSTHKQKHGHLLVHIGFDNKKVSLAVHRAVLLAFVGPCPEGMEACHNDGDPSNNSRENLRWDTHLANNQDRKAHGRYAVGEKHPMATLTIEKVRLIRAAASHAEAAKLAGIPYRHAWRIRSGESWSQVE